ncbi:MAG: hypothetical protein VW875_13960 [Planctomycetaceae bacterium]
MITVNASVPDPFQSGALPTPQFTQPPTPQFTQPPTQAQTTATKAGSSGASSRFSSVYEKAKAAAIDNTNQKSVEGNARYPNLSKYLSIIDIVIKIGFWVLLVVYGLVVVSIILQGLNLMVNFPAEGIGMIIGGVIAAPLLFLWLLFLRLVAYASSELLRVFMDIESNTRSS